MPSKGSMRKIIKGVHLVSNESFKQYSKQTGRKDKNRFKLIGHTLLVEMGKYVTEDVEGFKLPFNMGVLMVLRYSSKKKAINARKSKQLGHTVYYHNNHSFGDRIRTDWLKPQTPLAKFIKTFFFRAERTVARRASGNCFGGTVYKKIEKLVDRKRYLREIMAIDLIQEKYENKINKIK